MSKKNCSSMLLCTTHPGRMRYGTHSEMKAQAFLIQIYNSKLCIGLQ